VLPSPYQNTERHPKTTKNTKKHNNRPITVMFGAPIAVEKDEDPSPEKVEEVIQVL
jgi:hypothetical protein